MILVFGANKIPQLGDALGKGIRNFKKATAGDDAIDVTPKPGEQARMAPGTTPTTDPATNKKA